MRIANNLKEQNKELAQLNMLNLALQHNNYADFFKHIKYEWSETNKPIIDDLLGKHTEINYIKNCLIDSFNCSKTTRGAVQPYGHGLRFNIRAKFNRNGADDGGGAEKCLLRLDTRTGWW